MTAAAHTPGPWGARPVPGKGPNGKPDGRIWIDCAAHTKAGRMLGGTLAEVYNSGYGAGTPEANARLIAAAPELLEALRSARCVCLDAYKDTAMETDEDLLARIDAAIAKATGKVA